MTGTAQPERGKKEALVRIVKRAELSNNKRMLLRLVSLALALVAGGRFLLCQRPEQLAEILAALRAARLEPKRLAFVKNRPDAAPWLFLVEAQKGRKTGLRVEPDILIQSGAALYGPTTL